MKKVFFYFVAVSLVTACGHTYSADEAAQEMCKLTSQARKMRETKNMEGLKAVSAQMKTLSERLDHDFKDNPDAIRQIEEKVAACAGDFMK